MSSYLQIAIEAAKEAGHLQVSRLGNVQNIEYKGEINLVTEVDKACEALIAGKLQGAFPHHDMLAEEGGGERKNSDYKWIVDPLDGTTNFAHGYPLFCVSIALEHKGKIVVGVVYEPNRNELFTAEEGGGAFLNGKQVFVSKTHSLNRALLATGFAYNIREAKLNNLDHFKDILLSSQAVRRDGVAAVDLSYVACGRYDGFWELNLFPWDVAAGSLMVKEAGGQVSQFSGKPFSVYDKEILVSNSFIHEEMVTILKKEPKSKIQNFMNQVGM